MPDCKTKTWPNHSKKILSAKSFIYTPRHNISSKNPLPNIVDSNKSHVHILAFLYSIPGINLTISATSRGKISRRSVFLPGF